LFRLFPAEAWVPQHAPIRAKRSKKQAGRLFYVGHAPLERQRVFMRTLECAVASGNKNGDQNHFSSRRAFGS
jgi:hypothetical protein